MFLKFPLVSNTLPYFLWIVANIQVLLDCRSALLIFDLINLIFAITIPNLQKFLFCSSPLMIKTSPIAKADRFSFLHLILCFSRNHFSYSPFQLFHALSLYFVYMPRFFLQIPLCYVNVFLQAECFFSEC